MYIVTKDGDKLPVDDSSIDRKKSGCPMFNNLVGVYDEDTILRPVWILELNRSNCLMGKKNSDYELEFVKDLRYNHEPSQEEILWAMSAYGLGMSDVVFVRKGLELDCDYDD